MKRVIELSNLDVTNLSKEDVFEALMTSFSIDERKMPSKKYCYLGKKSLDGLKEKLNIPISLDEEQISTSDHREAFGYE